MKSKHFKYLYLLLLSLFLLSGCASNEATSANTSERNIINKDDSMKVYARLHKNKNGEYVLDSYCTPTVSYNLCPPEKEHSTDGGFSLSTARYSTTTVAGAFDWVNVENMTPAFDTSINFFFSCSHVLGSCKEDYPLLNLYYKKNTRVIKSFATNMVTSLGISNFFLFHYGDFYFDKKSFDKAVDYVISHQNINSEYESFIAATKKEIILGEQKYKKAVAESKRQRELAERNALEREMQEEARIQAILDNWNNKKFTKKHVGEKVCTFDNQFGYVEKIADHKIQIRRLGKVPNKESGYFFDNKAKSFTYNNAKNEMIWDDISNWGLCGFRNPD